MFRRFLSVFVAAICGLFLGPFVNMAVAASPVGYFDPAFVMSPVASSGETVDYSALAMPFDAPHFVPAERARAPPI